MEITKEAEQAFLKELTDLTNKYGIEIGGCGCCDSPYLHSEGDPSYFGPFLDLDEDGYKVH